MRLQGDVYFVLDQHLDNFFMRLQGDVCFGLDQYA